MGNSSNVRLLLERGAEVNTPAKDGTTALQTAVLRENNCGG
jgi:ankyrin repeat protein